ncbi:MAG TPA: SAM-dependent methyltransferase [Trebonia sp.]|nr:SAM-dependent methyltransferase [Trebonia sp.]
MRPGDREAEARRQDRNRDRRKHGERRPGRRRGRGRASHLTGEHDSAGWAADQRDYRAAGTPAQLRDGDEFARLAFAGLEMVLPGAVLVSVWRPEPGGRRPAPAEVSLYGGMGRKR